MFEPAVPEPTADTSRLTRSPPSKSQLAAVSVPSSEVPAAAIENAAATSEPTLRSAVSAEPTGAVVTATQAPVILPENGIAIVTILEVDSPPGIVNVIVCGARIVVDICTFSYVDKWNIIMGQKFRTCQVVRYSTLLFLDSCFFLWSNANMPNFFVPTDCLSDTVNLVAKFFH